MCFHLGGGGLTDILSSFGNRGPPADSRDRYGGSGGSGGGYDDRRQPPSSGSDSKDGGFLSGLSGYFGKFVHCSLAFSCSLNILLMM